MPKNSKPKKPTSKRPSVKKTPQKNFSPSRVRRRHLAEVNKLVKETKDKHAKGMISESEHDKLLKILEQRRVELEQERLKPFAIRQNLQRKLEPNALSIHLNLNQMRLERLILERGKIAQAHPIADAAPKEVLKRINDFDSEIARVHFNIAELGKMSQLAKIKNKKKKK